MVKLLILTSILLAAALIEPAYACRNSSQMRRLFPACEFSAPRPDERTTVVYASGGTGLSSVTFGSDAMVVEVVDIEIGAADKPHYIVLSSGKPIIWRFTGKIDAISRVVVLGSQYNGAARNGIVGVPRGRIIFTQPNMDKLNAMHPGGGNCLEGYAACEASAYFNIPKADKMETIGEGSSHSYHVDQFVEKIRGSTIKIPQDGSIEEGAGAPWGVPGVWSGTGLGRHEELGGTQYVESSQSYERGLIKIDAASVVSQEPVRDYAVLPARMGLQQLLDAGILIRPDDARFKAIYDRWNERISKPFRSKLDPDFLFSYKVSYLITKPTTLPAGLDRATFLVAEGVDAPDMNGNRYMACLYFADPKATGPDRRKCDAFLGGLALSPLENSLVVMTRWLERLQAEPQTEKDKCTRLTTVANGAYFAGVALRQPLSGPTTIETPPRHIDVVVNRPGEVALFLNLSGSMADWHILPSAQTQITNVVLGEKRFGNQSSEVHGLDPSIPAQAVVPKPLAASCQEFNVSNEAYLGGPGVLALDRGMTVLTGRGLDSLLRKTNDGSWPPISNDPDAPRLTLTID